MAGVRVLLVQAGSGLHSLWLAMSWVATAALRGRLKALAAAVLALMLTPGLAQASAFCDAINAGALDQTTTYSAGSVTTTNARMTSGLTTLNGLLTSDSTHAARLSWYNSGAKYAYDTGEQVTVTATITGTNLNARLYRG
jgi:hypothetical protein